MNGYCLLIVDDETLTLDLLSSAIRWSELGVSRVLTAKSMAAAKRQFEAAEIDVMICDIEMPGGSGLELLRWVRENGYGTENLFLTSHADFEYAQAAIRLGCINYLLKPVAFDVLSHEVAHALELKQAAEKEPVPAQGEGGEVSPSTIERVKGFIETHFTEDVTCQGLAKDFYISQEHLSRAFKQRYGISPSSYIQDCRLREAKRLLVTTSLSISDIAIQIGYFSYSYFSNVFKRSMGMSPMEYRKANAKAGYVGG